MTLHRESERAIHVLLKAPASGRFPPVFKAHSEPILRFLCSNALRRVSPGQAMQRLRRRFKIHDGLELNEAMFHE